MTEFERSVPQFRGGSISGENIDKNSFIELFADVFDTLLYQKLQAQSSSKSIDRAYTDNQTFWNDALKGLHFQSMHLQLQGFHLTEWIPSAPGRYFTSDAEKSREEAQRYINPHFDEYLPVGKEYMVLGGVGSVRLKAKFINSKSTYFLGASSTGISHQGIPIALLEAEYRQVIETIKNQGGCFANLVGTLQILPTSMALIHYDRKVPKYCLFLENIEVLRPSSTSELLTTVAIIFPSNHSSYSPRHYSRRSHKQGQSFSKDNYTAAFPKTWSFTSFCPSSINNLDAAIDWLKSYASRHSFMDNPPILNDFDEHYQHFDPVEFPISKMFSGSIDHERIKAYQSYYGFNVNIQELNLIDKRKGAFVSSDQSPITGLSGNTNVGAGSKVKVLFLAANPLGTDRLKLDEEIRAITEKVYASEYRDYLQIESSWAVRPDDLLQLLNRYRPHIVHFSGHGSQSGELILVDNIGSPKAVSTMALKALFTTLKDNIQVVILNACYSRSQATAITEVINCVVGMNDAIGDEAAIIFAASFYRALGFGRSVQQAFDQGKVALLLEGIPEENTPELFVRTGVNPSQVFLVEQPQAQIIRETIPPYVSGLNSTNPSIFLNSFSQALQYQDVQNVELHTHIKHFVATCDDSVMLPSSSGQREYGWKDIRKLMVEDKLEFDFPQYTQSNPPLSGACAHLPDTGNFYVVGTVDNKGFILPIPHFVGAVFVFTCVTCGSESTWAWKSVYICG